VYGGDSGHAMGCAMVHESIYIKIVSIKINLTLFFVIQFPNAFLELCIGGIDTPREKFTDGVRGQERKERHGDCHQQ
jgi:hypothetical protein